MSKTPTEIATASRQRYNSVNDTFYSDAEIIDIVYEGELDLAQYALVIEDVDTSVTTVAGTQSYSLPSNTIAIRRVEYDGAKLKKINFREDDALTGSNSDQTTQGTPQYYYEWNDKIYLRVLPDAAKTLRIHRYKEPTVLTTASTALSIPSRYHMNLIDYVVGEMAAKDKNFKVASYFNSRWELKKQRAKLFEQKRRRRDSMPVVNSEEVLGVTVLGAT